MRRALSAMGVIAAIAMGIGVGLGAGAAAACGADSDCPIGDRSYRISLPEGWDGTAPLAAIVFAHGHAGSADGVMRNTAFRRMASDLGVALIAAQGMGGDWDLPRGPGSMTSDGAADRAYFEALKTDVAARFHVDPDRTLMTGFSAGGMMVWDLACSRGDLFAAYLPMSGTFWGPVPDTCAGPVASIVHIHGTTDSTVPMTGRAIGPARQGDLGTALAMYRAFGGFSEAARTETVDDMACEMRTNAAGQVLDLCLFDGGHSFRLETVRWAWERLSGLGIITP